MINLKLLDNPVWHALNSHHRHLAIRGEIPMRYPSDVTFTAALPELNSAGLRDLKQLVELDETITLAADSLPEDIPGWQILRIDRIPQFVCEHLASTTPVDAVELTLADVPEMLDLVALTEPGPFFPSTIEMGLYLGVYQEGQLVAMAGQRLHLTGFCEISSVCTHPAYRGRGYASALTTMVAEAIFANQETPFLHNTPSNEFARRLYLKMGFRQRKEIPVAILKRVA